VQTVVSIISAAFLHTTVNTGAAGCLCFAAQVQVIYKISIQYDLYGSKVMCHVISSLPVNPNTVISYSGPYYSYLSLLYHLVTSTGNYSQGVKRYFKETVTH
jgi:hypothetical protein